MKRKILYFGSALLTLLLCAMILLGTALPAAAADTSLDYGIYGRENNTEYVGAELYRYLFESEPTEAEAKYLNRMGLTFGYNSTIPSSVVSTDYNGDEGVLSVTVRPYRYTASNGLEVTWVPTKATVDGAELPLTPKEGVYIGKLENIFRAEDFDMEVDYAWDVTIPKETVARLRNEAYTLGATAYAAQSEYEKKLAEYEKKIEDYYAWQEYLTNKALYDAYCEALKDYNTKLAAYEKYREERSAYVIENAAYEQWQNYYKDLEKYKEEYAKYSNYQNYLATMEVVKKKLGLMEILYKCDSHSWAIYYSTMGPTVTSVVARKDELVNVLFCSEEDVDLAGASTEALRELFRGYDPLRKTSYVNEYEGIAERYAYFAEHYDDFKLHFTNLYKSLKALIKNVSVEQVLDSQGQREHYLQFVGQLYVISTCFDEEGVRDPSWRIAGLRLDEVLEPVHLLEDGDWNPANTPMPEYTEVVYCPTPVRIPSAKKPERKPIAPEFVEHPGKAPTPVANPDEGTVPPQVESYPANPPTAPETDALTASLVNEIRAGILKKYEGAIEDMTLCFSSKLLRRVSITNMKTVIFHDIDGTVLNTASVAYGESAYLEDTYMAPPEHATSPAYIYRNPRWIGADGSNVDLSCVTQDIDLYPYYEMIKKSYTVTWRITGADGEVAEYPSIWSYGSVPTPGVDVPYKSYDTYGYTYNFSDWDREIEAVTGDIVYSGSFQKNPKKFPIRWVVGNTVTTEMLEYGSMPSFAGSTEIASQNEKCTFLGFSPEISVVKGAATYTAMYERRPYAVGGVSEVLSLSADATHVTVAVGTHSSVAISSLLPLAEESEKGVALSWDNGCRLSVALENLKVLQDSGCARIVLESFEENGDTVYELHLYNDRLEEIALENGSVTFHLPYEEFEDGKMTAFFLRDASGKETRIEQKSVAATSGVTVRCAYAYPLRVQHHLLCNTMAIDWDALIGSKVSLDVTCELGYEITGIEVKDAKGTAISLDGYSFVMPESAVDIAFTVEPIVYHLVFKSEGKVLLDKTYNYGEKPEIPPAPLKEGDETYVYSFLSWGRDIPAFLTGDERELVFEAQFARAVRDIDYDTGHNNNLLVELVLPCVLGGILLIGVGITVLVILRKRRKRRG